MQFPQATQQLTYSPGDPVHTRLIGFFGHQANICDRIRYPEEDRLLASMRSLSSAYEPRKLTAIRLTDSSEAFYSLSQIKTRSALAWIDDILSRTAGNKIFSLEATAKTNRERESERAQLVETAAAKIQQMIQANASQMFAMTGATPDPMTMALVAMEKLDAFKSILRSLTDQADREELEKAMDEIQDVFDETGFIDKLNELAHSCTELGSGILRVDKEPWRMSVAHPLDFYPSADWRPYDPETKQQHGLCFERVWISKTELLEMAKEPHVIPGAIEKVVRYTPSPIPIQQLYPFRISSRLHQLLSSSGHENSDFTHGYQQSANVLEMFNFHGAVPLSVITGDPTQLASVPVSAMYHVQCGAIVKLQLPADRESPYLFSVFSSQLKKLWGDSVPFLVRHPEEAICASFRSGVNNIGFGSGPMMEVDSTRFPPGQAPRRPIPWMTFSTNRSLPNQQKAVNFHQPNVITDVILRFMDKMELMAEELSGVPRYSHGIQKTSGAATTASGLSLLIEQAGKGIKLFIHNLHRQVVSPLVYRIYLDLHQKGLIRFDAKVTVSGLLSSEAQSTRRDRIITALSTTANPVDTELIGPEGRLTLLKEVFSDLPVLLEILERRKQEIKNAPQVPVMAGAPAAPVAQGGVQDGQAGASATPIPPV